MEWQRKNKASIHRTAKEFAIDHKWVCEWCQCYSTLIGQTGGVLGKLPFYAVANLCQSMLTTRYSSFWRMREAEEGVYLQDKMSDLAYNPTPYTFD